MTILVSTNSTSVAPSTGSASLGLVFQDVPSFGKTLNASQAIEWRQKTQECAGSATDFATKKRMAVRQLVAMVVMDAQQAPAGFFEGELKNAKLGVPRSKNPLAAAFAYHLKLDVANADKKKRSDDSKALNRYANAGQRLFDLARAKMPAQDGGIDITYDSAGVAMLMDIIDDEGGVNAMALSSQSDPTEAGAIIKIAPDAHVIRQANLAKARFGKSASGTTGELVFALALQPSGQEAKIARTLELPPEAMALVYSTLDLADEHIRFLAELFAIGEMIIEEKTNILVNHEDNPDDPVSPRRLASRQFVFHPDGKMSISPILNPSGVIITVKPSVDLLGEPIQGHVRLQTYGRRRAAANIKDKKRRDAFDFEVTGPGDTEGIKRIKLTTPVAATDDDQKLDVGMLIEQVRSRTSNFPTIVADSFRPTINTGDLTDLVAKMKDVASVAKKLGTKGAHVRLTLAAQSLSIACHSPIVSLPAPQARTSGTVNVHPDDFVAVTEALAQIQLKSPVSAAMDDDLLVLRFDTEFAHYEVHLPSVSDKLQRSNRHIVKMSPVTWPRIGEPLANDKLPESELPSDSTQASNDELPNV